MPSPMTIGHRVPRRSAAQPASGAASAVPRGDRVKKHAPEAGSDRARGDEVEGDQEPHGELGKRREEGQHGRSQHGQARDVDKRQPPQLRGARRERAPEEPRRDHAQRQGQGRAVEEDRAPAEAVDEEPTDHRAHRHAHAEAEAHHAEAAAVALARQRLRHQRRCRAVDQPAAHALRHATRQRGGIRRRQPVRRRRRRRRARVPP